MKEEQKIIVGLYPRVSTEDQSRYGHSMEEQEDRLIKLCNYKDYEIYKVYREAGVSAKNTNRPEFTKMIEDMKQGKINKIVVYKLDRLTRSIKDLEEICKLLEEYNCSLESISEDINTSTANGKFFIRMLTILAQLEIERTSERTAFGLVGAAKKGHICSQTPLGYSRKEKKLIINDVESEVIKRIFDMYLKGNSVNSIVKTFNEENLLNRIWATTTLDKILSNKLYTGDYEYGKRSKSGNVQIFENVVPAIIDKASFALVQKQKEKNLKNYKRKVDYIFMQSIICPKCNKIMGGCSSKSKSGRKHLYYKCACCNKRVSEQKIEKPLLLFLNDMLDYFLIIDNTFKPFLNNNTKIEINKYNKMINDLNIKEKRIKKAFVDGILESTDLKEELDEIIRERKTFESKINELTTIKNNEDNKLDLKTIFNLKEIEKQKIKSDYFKKNGLWNKLNSLQKQTLIKKYIESIEIDFDKNNNIIIKNININTRELENIGYMFRSDCFDMIINVDDQDIILSNYTEQNTIDKYVNKLREFYNIEEIIIEKEQLNLQNYLNKNNITTQIIPIKNNDKFGNKKYTILQIGT